MQFVVTVNIFWWFIVETVFLVEEGGSRRWVKVRTERRMMMNLQIWKLVGSIATLKQKKTSAKSSFTRARHKFEGLLKWRFTK